MIKNEIGIVTSALDPAGKNIREYLSKNHFHKKIGEFEGSDVLEKEGFILIETTRSLLDTDHLDKEFDVDLWLFGSKHAAKSGINSLTVHSPGNWNKALYGGKDKEIAFSDAFAIKNCLLSLNALKKDDMGYIVSLEVTHHGPSSLKKPVVFVEIGSDEKSWKDKKAAEIVGESILAARNNQNWKICVGFGGTHYAPSFTELVLETEYATGHIAPKYVFLEEAMVRQAFQKTIGAEALVLDWKGLNKDQKNLIIGVNDRDLKVPLHKVRDIINKDD